MIDLKALTNDFAPGLKLCVHIEDWREHVRISKYIVGLARKDGKRAALASPAEWTSVFAKWLARDRVANWLSKKAGIPKETASALISSSPHCIHPRLSCNAGTPRRILGIMAVLQTTDVLIYNTLGLDPSGIQTIHAFVSQHCDEFCAVNVDVRSFSGDGLQLEWICPEGAKHIQL